MKKPERFSASEGRAARGDVGITVHSLLSHVREVEITSAEFTSSVLQALWSFARISLTEGRFMMTFNTRLCDTMASTPLQPGWRNWQTQRTQNRPRQR